MKVKQDALFRPRVEELEDRIVLAARIFLEGGLVSIIGTQGADKVRIDTTGNELKVSLSGVSHQVKKFALDQVSAFRFQGLGGDDRVINNSSKQIFASGGAGNDFLTGGQANDKLLGGDGRDTLISGGGDDVLKGGAGKNQIVRNGMTANPPSLSLVSQPTLGTTEVVVPKEEGTLPQVNSGEPAEENGVWPNEEALPPESESLFFALGPATGPSVSSQVVGQSLQVTGTDLDDTIEVRQFGGDLWVMAATREAGQLVSSVTTRFQASLINSIVVDGGIGNDILRIAFPSPSNQFFIRLAGGLGEDRLESVGAEVFMDGGPGNDIMTARTGTVSLDFSSAPAAIVVDLEAGVIPGDGNGGQDRVSGVANVLGSPFDDTILGDEKVNKLLGNGGNDTVDGRRGDDKLDGGPGRDIVRGSHGNDSMTGGSPTEDEVDQLDGGTDNDTMMGGGGADGMQGGSGDDEIHGQAGDDNLDGGEDSDKVYGETGQDFILGSGGNDYLDGGLDSENEADEIEGGSGNDTAWGGGGVDDIRGDIGVDELHGQSGNDQIRGGEDGDSLYGGAGEDGLDGEGGGDYLDGGLDSQDEADRLDGGVGGDVLWGGGGPDVLRGGPGDDILHGESGDDRLWGDADDDQLDGGMGTDYAQYARAVEDLVDSSGNIITAAYDRPGVRVDLVTGSATGQGADTLVGVEGVVGSDGKDTLIGNTGQKLVGGSGDDEYVVNGSVVVFQPTLANPSLQPDIPGEIIDAVGEKTDEFLAAYRHAERNLASSNPAKVPQIRK